MRLIKLQELSTRPVTSMELVTKYMFGDKFPEKFTPSKYYYAGDYVYHVDNHNNASIYYCTTAGTYNTIDSSHWVPGKLPDVIKYQVEKYIAEHGGIGGSTEPAEITESKDVRRAVEYVKGLDQFSFKTYTEDDLTHINNTITLPFIYNEYMYQVDVYVNRLKLSELDGDYTINWKTITLSQPLTDSDEFFINVLEKKNDGSRLIYRMEKHPSHMRMRDTSVVAWVPLDPMYIEKSLVFDVYVNGKYISETNYTFQYDIVSEGYNIIFTAPSQDMLSLDTSMVNIEFTMSSSKEVLVIKNDIYKSADNTMESFNIDLTYTDFKHIDSIYTCYDNGMAIPNGSTVLYNNHVHISNPEYYMSTPHFVISYKNLVFSSIYESDYDGSSEFYDTVKLPEQFINNRRVPVPFIEYNKDNGDLLLFRDEGYYVSSPRYYIDNSNILTFYLEDESLVEGTKLSFRVLDNDYSIHAYTHQIMMSIDFYNDGFKLPMLNFNQKHFSLFIFTREGMYISSDKYEIDENNWLKFKSNSNITPGMKIDLIMLEYCTARTNTITKRFVVKPGESFTFQLPWSYDLNDDNVVILTSTGRYIDPSKYIISNTGVVTIKSGTTIGQNEVLDIYLFRRLSDSVLISTVDHILSNI